MWIIANWTIRLDPERTLRPGDEPLEVDDETGAGLVAGGAANAAEPPAAPAGADPGAPKPRSRAK